MWQDRAKGLVYKNNTDLRRKLLVNLLVERTRAHSCQSYQAHLNSSIKGKNYAEGHKVDHERTNELRSSSLKLRSDLH